MATWEVARGGRRRRVSPRAVRALRRGPRAVARPVPDRGREPAAAGSDVSAPAGALAEWHDMTPGELIAAWAGLRAWVAWLSGRYELSVDNRLPACWALHPGLVEELWAVKAWREEIYSSGQPGQGQAARYWHADLQALILAASSMYAAGCRTGHRGAVELAGLDPGLLREWGGAYPLAGVPAVDIAAGTARFTDGWASGEAMAAVLDSGAGSPVVGSEPPGQLSPLGMVLTGKTHTRSAVGGRARAAGLAFILRRTLAARSGAAILSGRPHPQRAAGYRMVPGRTEASEQTWSKRRQP
jgi:hypothetical protein